MFWCAVTLAFFGFFRAGELTSAPNTSPSPRLGDISLRVDHFVLRLCFSKTDPFHHVCDVVVGVSDKDVCALGAAAEYLRIRSRLGVAWKRDAALLATRAGNALTSSNCSLALRKRLASAGLNDAAQYAAHRFRIGAATAVGRQGVPEWLIQPTGRWNSNYFEVYVRTQPEQLRQLAAKLAA